MHSEIQNGLYKSIMRSIGKIEHPFGEETVFQWIKFYVFNAPTSHHKATDYLDVSRNALKDEDALAVLDSHEQAPVRFYASPTTSSYELPQSINELIDNGRSSPQSLAVTVRLLVNIVTRNEFQILSSLTDEDYQCFLTSLDRLIDVVGEDENHLFAPLMHFIGRFIEKFEEQSDSTDWEESLDIEEVKNDWRSGIPLPVQGLEAAYSDDETEYTLDMLIEENPDYEDL